VTSISWATFRAVLVMEPVEKMRITREGLCPPAGGGASAVTCVTMLAAQSNCLNGDDLALEGHFWESPNTVVLVQQGSAQEGRT
jgi:hypothetical protein